jgi:phage terminase large subunit GpA-like protein
LWVDEASSLPMEIDDKGDPIENAEARQTNFPDRKTLLTSTPGSRGACRITWEFETRSDRRRYGMLMPCCGKHAVIEWPHMVWDTPDGEVFCQCPACGERVEQHHKTTMLAGGIWTPTAKGDGETAGFHLPGWYAPYGWLSWEKIRDEFMRAKSDPLLLKGWVNKRAAEAWEDESLAKVSADGLMSRVGGYDHGSCPADVLTVVMAVDVQDTWLEVSVWGYGRGDEAWRIWHQKIEGDPGQDHVWQQVTTIREIAWPREGGGTIKAVHCAVDTGGHYTGEAYEYCRRYAKDGVVAIKGSSQRNAPVLGKGTKQDVNFKGKIIKNGVTLYMIGTHAIKRTVYSRLKIEEHGPGYVHFDNATSDDYLQGLTCERLQPRYVKGFQVLEWVKPSGARNEPLDLKVYCLAMLELLKRRYNRATMWDQLQAQVQASIGSNQPAPRRSRSFTVI